LPEKNLKQKKHGGLEAYVYSALDYSAREVVVTLFFDFDVGIAHQVIRVAGGNSGGSHGGSRGGSNSFLVLLDVLL